MILMKQFCSDKHKINKVKWCINIGNFSIVQDINFICKEITKYYSTVIFVIILVQ